jgi:aspartyl protease family protein
MGITYVRGSVAGAGGERAEVEFLVDSGATYTLLPADVWRRVGLAPRRRMRFRLPDGTAMERNVSECLIELPQGSGHTPVILGEDGDQALLGTVTLEELGLVLNPFTRELQPMQALLM